VKLVSDTSTLNERQSWTEGSSEMENSRSTIIRTTPRHAAHGDNIITSNVNLLATGARGGMLLAGRSIY